MKKFLAYLLLSCGILVGAVSASGCFHDALSTDAHYEKIVKGANVRNVACMYGSQVMTTLSQGTIVRVISYNQYRKQIELADGRAGRIGTNFAERTTSTASIPCSGVTPADYCDTTNLARCPEPSPQGVEPLRYTRTAPSPYNCSTTPVSSTATTTTTTTTTPSTAIQVTDALKIKLDAMVASVVTKVDAKYSDNITMKITHYKTLISVLQQIQKTSTQLKDLIGYLVTKFEEVLAMAELEKVLQVE